MKNPSPKAPHPDDDRLLDLAHGLLAPDREKELLAHLATCDGCEERFRTSAADVERTRAIAAEALAGLPTRRAAARTTASSAWSWLPRARAAWSLGVAAAAVTAALLFVTVLRPGPAGNDPSSLLHWLPDAGESVVTRNPGASAADQALAEGLAAYARHDMKAAVASLGRAHASGPMADMVQIYYGSALAWTGDYHEAVRHLSEVRTETLPEPWRGETQWTLYVALRTSGEGVRADSLLGIMASGRGEAAGRARAALKGKD